MSDSKAAVATILIVDDEKSIRDSLRMILEFEGYQVAEAAGGREALARVSESTPEAILLDIKMPEMDGLAVFRALRERGFEMPVIIITGHGDVETALETTRAGAYDFFEKPLQRERVLVSLRNAIAAHRLRLESGGAIETEDLVGTSAAIEQLRERIERAAPTPATVLISGESGTGKELVARAIHRKSLRREQPYIQVNCAAIPEELIESELFGHEKGSFTGAVRKQVGKFVAADRGTIFLDEVGDMSARTQAKVLRVLQNGEVEPVGAGTVVRVDVRVVAATHRNLGHEIKEGRFREDLFYRLNVVPIRTPPLREHLEDIPMLVEYFVRQYSLANNYRPKSFSPDALTELSELPWKGNVRELRNLVERLLILSPGDEVSRQDVAAALGGNERELTSTILSAPTLRQMREKAERLFLIKKLEENGWNVTRTAELIGTPRSNLYKKMEQYGIERPEGG